MNSCNRRFRRAGLCVIGLLMLVGCGRAPRIDSDRLQGPIEVDGRDADWHAPRYLLEEVPVTFSVANDDSFVYLCAVTSDRGLQLRILRSGIELWLDPRGGLRHRVGVRLPSVSPLDDWPPGGPFEQGFERGGRRGGRQAEKEDELDAHLAQRFTQAAGLRELYLLDGPGDEGTRLSAGHPVQVQLWYDKGRLVYEARVPLAFAEHPSFQLQIGKKPVGLSLRIPAPQVPDRQLGEGAPGGMPGLGRGSGEMRDVGGTRGPGGGRDGRMRRVEPMQQWVHVVLH